MLSAWIITAHNSTSFTLIIMEQKLKIVKSLIWRIPFAGSSFYAWLSTFVFRLCLLVLESLMDRITDGCLLENIFRWVDVLDVVVSMIEVQYNSVLIPSQTQGLTLRVLWKCLICIGKPQRLLDSHASWTVVEYLIRNEIIGTEGVSWLWSCIDHEWYL